MLEPEESENSDEEWGPNPNRELLELSQEINDAIQDLYDQM